MSNRANSWSTPRRRDGKDGCFLRRGGCFKSLVKTIRVGKARAYLPYLAKGKIKVLEYAFAICKSSLRRV